MPPLILASTSKTRAALLEGAGLPFDVVQPLVDEEALKEAFKADAVAPKEMAQFLAEAKGHSVSLMQGDALVISADQVLDFRGQAMSKPADTAAALEALASLSGDTHRLHTSVALHQKGMLLWHHTESPTLRVRSLSKAQRDTYLQRVGSAALWSVGSYQLEGLGVQLFDTIDGDYFSILGLPLVPLLSQLRLLGVDSLS